MTKIIICKCGAVIRGSSKIHAEANLTLHKRSNKHKELIKLKKVQESTLNRKSESSRDGVVGANSNQNNKEKSFGKQDKSNKGENETKSV